MPVRDREQIEKLALSRGMAEARPASASVRTLVNAGPRRRPYSGYGLVEIDVADLEDTRNLPFDWHPTEAPHQRFRLRHYGGTLICRPRAAICDLV